MSRLIYVTSTSASSYHSSYNEQQQNHDVPPTPKTKKQPSNSSALNSLIAGYAAGITTVLVGHPMDSVKVWKQTAGSIKVKPTVSVATGAATMNMTPSSSSLKSLYAGVSGPMLAMGLVQSSSFAAYDATKRILQSSFDDDGLLHVALASIVAGGVQAILTNPLFVIKTKQQLMTQWDMTTAIRQTWQCPTTKTFSHSSSMTRPLNNFFVGWTPHVCAEIIGRCVYLTSYEFLKGALVQYRRRGRDDDDDITTTSHEWMQTDAHRPTLEERMVSASIAGMLSWTVIFPLDVLRNCMFCQSLAGSNSTTAIKQSSANVNMWELARSIYQEHNHSIKPFYRGFGITLLRSGPVSAVVLPVYDMTLEWLNRPGYDRY